MTHGIVETLKSNATLQAFLGKDSGNDTYKVYPVIAPDKERPPYIVCRVSNVRPFICKGEPSNQEADTVQVDCYHNSYEACYQLYRIARLALDNVTSSLSDGTTIESQFENARDLTASEMQEIAKRDCYGIISLYGCDVKLGNIT